MLLYHWENWSIKLSMEVYLFQNKLFFEKSSSEISISPCLWKTSADSVRVNEFILFLKANEEDDVETKAGGEERYHGSPAAAVYQALIRWWEGCLFLFFFTTPSKPWPANANSRSHLFGLPEMRHDGRMRVPVMKIATLWVLETFLAGNFCESWIAGKNFVPSRKFKLLNLNYNKLYFHETWIKILLL